MKQPRALQEMARARVFDVIFEKCISIEHDTKTLDDDQLSIARTNEMKANYLYHLPPPILDDICALANEIQESRLIDETVLYRIIMHRNLKTFNFLKSNESRRSSDLLRSSARETFWLNQLQLQKIVNLNISGIWYSPEILATIGDHCRLLENITIPALNRTHIKNSNIDRGLFHLLQCKELRSLIDFFEFSDVHKNTICVLLKTLKKLEKFNYRLIGEVLYDYFYKKRETFPMLANFNQYNPAACQINCLQSLCPNIKHVTMKDADDPSDVLTMLQNSQLNISSLELDSFPCSYDIYNLLQGKPVCANLDSLKLLRCTNDFDRGTISEIAECCPSLRVLHLSSEWKLPMKLNQVEVNPRWFNNLQELLIRGSKSWDPEVFLMCLSFARGIQLIKLDHFFDKGFEMSKYFLELFKINPTKELKALTLWQYRSYLTPEVMLWLTTNCCQLTDLELYCYMYPYLPPEDLARIKQIVNVVISPHFVVRRT